MTRILDRIGGPRDLHGLSDDELQQVAQEVRELLIDTVGEIGGHFGANLGACEIAVALHSLLDSPRDKVLWDVGHQAYPHKILTGRRDQIATIRKYGGLAPFCSIFESEHDIMGAGHASTSIGYAVGLKEAMRHGAGKDGKVAAVIGDGAMTGGVAFEAIHQAGGLGTPLVVVLNDNGMSISPNVGALSRYFNRVRLEPKMWRAREGVEEKLTKLPAGIGTAVERLGPQLKESIKAFTSPGLWWEELDWAYMGVIDGHDVHALRDALRRAFEAEAARRRARRDGQGQGLLRPPRRAASRGWRSGTPPSRTRSQAHPAPARRRQGAKVAPPQYTKVFGEALVGECRPRRARRRHHRGDELRHGPVDPPKGAARPLLRRRHRGAAGRAVRLRPRPAGTRPVCAIYSTFLQRAYDQIVHDVCIQSLPVVFCLDRAGLVGDDGQTHQRGLRPRLPALPAEHDDAGAARRGDTRPHAPHRRCGTTPGRSRSASRAARASACRCTPIRRGSRSAPARCCARVGAWRSWATARASAWPWAPPASSPTAAST